MAGAEIVHRDGAMLRLQIAEHAGGQRRIVDDGAFRQLHHQALAANAVNGQGLRHHPGDIVAGELEWPTDSPPW